MVARGGTPRKLMLAARPGDHRRNLFTKVVVRSSTRRALRDAMRLATVEEKSQTPDRRLAARGLRQYGPIEKGGRGYARSERATHRRGSPVARSVPVVLGNPRLAARRGTRK